MFLDPNDTSEKTCFVTHGLCDHEKPENAQKCSKNSPYIIQFQVSDRSSRKYCYTVTASNRTYTVKVNGTLVLGMKIFSCSRNNLALMHIILF
jgi:hypothetical protein